MMNPREYRWEDIKFEIESCTDCPDWDKSISVSLCFQVQTKPLWKAVGGERNARLDDPK